MLSTKDWKREPRIVDAYREVVLFMSEETDVPLEEFQGAVEYLLDAIKRFRPSSSA